MGMLRRLLRRDSGVEHARRSGPQPNSRPTPRTGGSAPVARTPLLAPVPRVLGPADAVLMAAVISLVCFGVVMVYSASAVLAYSRFDDGQHYLVRQAAYAAVGVVAMVLLARLDYHRLRPLTYPILAGSLSLLCMTAFGFGKTVGGASRWLEIGPVHVQPAEIAKVAMIFWLSYSLSKKRERIRSFTIGFLPHVLAALVVMVLCLRQPDFGSAVMVGMLTFVLLFTAGARLGYILGALLLALPIAYQLIAGSEYRMRRITAFLSPFQYRFGAGYQIAESLMGFGAGGATGTGIGDSRQKLFFLPEAHTDFISSIVGEELGFVGFCVMVLAFLVIVHRGLRAAFRAVDEYGTYLATGITVFVGLQAFTNLAVALGLLPTKGLVLPFLSYGGSALLVNCGAIGILLNVSRPRQSATAPGTTAEHNVRVGDLQPGGIS